MLSSRCIRLRVQALQYFAHRLALYQVLAALFYGIIRAIQLVIHVFVRHSKLQGDDIGCAVIGYFSVFSSWVKLMFTSWVVLHLLCLLHMGQLELGAGLRAGKMTVPKTNFYLELLSNLYCGMDLLLFCSIVNTVGIIIIIARLACCKPSSEEAPLLKSGQRMKALNELLPLLIYPILFCILLIPPLVNRVIGAIPDIHIGIITSSTVISGVCIPLQSLLAGLALIVHIAVLKCPKCKCFQKHQQHHPIMQRAFSSEHPVTWELTKGDTATRDATEAFLPNESEVDNLLLTQKAAQARV